MRPKDADQTGRLEEIVDRFEAAWDRKEAPAVEDFLSDSDPARARVLFELLSIDLEFRLKAGLAVRVEDYLGRFPELGEDPAAVVALVVAEYRFRNRVKPGLTQQEYLERFPKYRDLLASNSPLRSRRHMRPTCRRQSTSHPRTAQSTVRPLPNLIEAQ